MTPEGLALIKEFEGLELTAYKDPVGIWTIGYGTTAAAGVGIAPKAGMKITEAQAEAYLEKALTKFWAMIEPAIKRKPNEYQADAMLSMAYNIGVNGFKGSSVLRLWNAGDISGAAKSFLLWNKGTVNGKKVVLKGLTRRREAERDLFLRNVATHETSTKPVVEQKPPIRVPAAPVQRHPDPPALGFWARIGIGIARLLAFFREGRG